MKMMLCSVGVLFFVAVGCGPEPYYDDDIGVEAVPVGPGELAGKFALKMSITTVTDLPIIGPQEGGGDTFVMVTRTYNDDGTYSQVHEVCGGRILSQNSVSELPESSWRAVPAQEPRTVEIRDEDGFYDIEGHLELWGLGNMDDPWEDELPEDDLDALEEPHASQIVDTDEDGNPGMTITVVEGLVTGEFYFAQRKKTQLEGVVQGPDLIFGLNTTSFEQTILGNGDDQAVLQGYPQEKHPEPKLNWFEEIRIDDDDDCDRVVEAVENEEISKFRPFD